MEGEIFFEAIKRKDYKVMLEIIKGGYDLNKLYMTENKKISPICYAMNLYDPKVVDFLLKNGADPNLYSGLSVLQYSINGYSCGITEVLLMRGANPNMKGSSEDDYPLVKSMNYADITTFELLLKYGADPNVKNKEGEYIIITLSKLFKNQYENMCRENMDHEYHTRVITDSFEKVKLLLKKDCDFYVTDEEGNDFLHYFEGHDEMKEELEELCKMYSVNVKPVKEE